MPYGRRSGRKVPTMTRETRFHSCVEYSLHRRTVTNRPVPYCRSTAPTHTLVSTSARSAGLPRSPCTCHRPHPPRQVCRNFWWRAEIATDSAHEGRRVQPYAYAWGGIGSLVSGPKATGPERGRARRTRPPGKGAQRPYPQARHIRHQPPLHSVECRIVSL